MELPPSDQNFYKMNESKKSKATSNQTVGLTTNKSPTNRLASLNANRTVP